MAGVLDTLIYGYRTIRVAGQELVQRSEADFISGFTVTDNPVTGRTEISVGNVSGLSFPSEARGDVVIRGASTWQRLAADTAGKTLRTNGPGADASWGYPANLTIASEARGDLLVRGASVWQRLAVGTVSKFLRADGTDPAWGDIDVIAGGSGVVTITCASSKWAPGSTLVYPTDNRSKTVATTNTTPTLIDTYTIQNGSSLMCFATVEGFNATTGDYYCVDLKAAWERHGGVTSAKVAPAAITTHSAATGFSATFRLNADNVTAELAVTGPSANVTWKSETRWSVLKP